MTDWLEIERRDLYAGLTVRVFHEHDGRPPRGRVTMSLDVDDGAGGWHDTGRAPRWVVRTKDWSILMVSNGKRCR